MGDSAGAGAYYAQEGFDARFEWGIEGMQRLAPHSDVVVIVDVLRFTTAVDVAVARGAVVYPYHGRPDGSAEAYARELGARLADWRGATTSERPYSLSLAPDERLVLPSPNGATLAFLAAATPATVLAGCLRNATAVAAAAREHGGLVAVIAAGERWERDSGGLRPAVEDMLGAGAILRALRPAAPSPEAHAAMAAFQAAQSDLRAHLFGCSSGRELVQKGFSADVEIAAGYDVSRAVPILRERAFRALR
jgi:2-phosphosulfolactate phosphatase